MSRIVSATRLRRAVLEGFYSGWEKRPGPKDYFPAQQVWDIIYKKFPGRVDGPLAEGVFNGLLQEGHIEAIKIDDESIGARITDRGRNHLEELRAGLRTRRIAVVGAVTGSLGLAVSILKIVIDAMK